MLTRKSAAVLTIAALGLGACTVAPPSAPTLLATPPEGKAIPQFQNEDYNCRGYASSQVGDASTAATNSAVGSAAVGTALGAAAGALIGSAGGAAGAGAAVGAGMGLMVGGAAGANQANAVGYSAQQRYDMAYAQCMTSAGNTIQGPIAPPPVYAPAYAAPYPYVYGPAVVVAPRPYYYGYGYRPWGWRRW